MGPSAMSCAAVEDVGARGEPLHEGDVVLAEQDGRAPLRLHVLEHRAHLVGLAVVEARGRLVEEEQHRVAHQRPGQLDQPAGAEGQRLRRDGRRPR